MSRPWVFSLCGSVLFVNSIFAKIEFYPIEVNSVYKYEISWSQLPYVAKKTYMIYKNNKYLNANTFVRDMAKIDTLGDTSSYVETCTIGADNAIHCKTSFAFCYLPGACSDSVNTLHPFYIDANNIQNPRASRSILFGSAGKILVFDTLLMGSPGTRIQVYLKEVYSDKYGLLIHNYDAMLGMPNAVSNIKLIEFNGKAINVDSLITGSVGIKNNLFKNSRVFNNRFWYQPKYKGYLLNGRVKD